MKRLYDELCGLYSVDKTLRFELKPIGKTMDNILKNNILKKDEHRADVYERVKKYCDEYHKYFIDSCLKDLILLRLDEYFKLYKKLNRDELEEERFNEIKIGLRKQIVKKFTSNDLFKGLFSKDLIESYLKAMYKDDLLKLDDINEFEKFTTYFVGFNQNRKNMYSEEEKSSSIAYRLINENLPFFVSNILVFNKILSENSEFENIINQSLKTYLPVLNVKDMFDINYYNEVLTEVGIDTYNMIISGVSENKEEKLKGINEIINEYNQKYSKKLPKLKLLYKQILSDKTTLSFTYDSIDSDVKLLDLINSYFIDLNFFDKLNSIGKLLNKLEIYDLEKIYINNDKSITDLSKNVYDDWSKIINCLKTDYDNNYKGKSKPDSNKFINDKEKYFKNIKSYSISRLCLSLKDEKIINYFKAYFDENRVIDQLKEKFDTYKTINIDTTTGKLNSKNAIFIIKDLLDMTKRIQEFFKVLIPKDNTILKDEKFYSEYLELYSYFDQVIAVYNKVRNYLTKKPYSIKKIKINFNCSTLLDGWDVNKQKDNLGVIFIKDKNYYLGIINDKYKKIFDEAVTDNDCYNKMEYKLLPGPNKMLPKVFFSKKGIEKYIPSKEILDIYNNGLFKKGDKFDLSACHKLIDFYKKAISQNEDWKAFDFKFLNTKDYNDISEFYRDVANQGYKINYTKWSTKYINKLIEEGKLYLFQIYNKDFSSYSKGKSNLHTMYWKCLFDEENMKHIVYKLNGNAEIFFRKSSLKYDKPTHPANQYIKNKNINNPKKESLFSYDLIKDKRYTLDKFYFHAPITLNFVSKEINNINKKVNEYIKNEDDIYVIGIDRGERNLLYYTVIDKNGKIIEQNSLNVIKNNYKNEEFITDYHLLLDNKEKERDKARKTWESIENIKELKDGYMSQIINKITELLKKYNAIIVIEDLNNGFKNSRIKVEKQVYQKFEKKLIDKLNYLVFKDAPKEAKGGLLSAYQLTNKFNSFAKLGKQTGILFYIPAWNTSKIDPTTGFVNLFHIKNDSLEKSNEFVKKITDIRYNDKEDYFEFDIDYKFFTDRLNDSKANWTICTYGDRILTFRNKEKNNEWDCMKINLTEQFKKLFELYKIDFNNLKDEIISKADSKFYNAKLTDDEKIIGFTMLFKLIVQMRNSVTNSDIDYLISPVKNDDNEFFDTRKGRIDLPKDADANGAYNIARKGLMLVNQIKETKDDGLGKIKYNITNKEWLNFSQNKR